MVSGKDNIWDRLSNKTSVIATVLLLVIAGSIFISAVTFTATVWLENREFQRKEESVLQERINGYLVVMEAQFRVADFQGLDQVATLVVSDPYVNWVVVEAKTGNKIVERGETLADKESIKIKSFDIPNSSNPDVLLGRIVFGTQKSLSDILLIPIAGFLPMILSIIALAVFSYILVKRLVTSPIVALNVAARKYHGHKEWPELDLRGPKEILDLNETLRSSANSLFHKTLELENTNIELVGQVTRTRAAEAAFRESQKLEIVGQLSGGIAHDFNNLLAVILGNIEIVEEEELTRTQVSGLDSAKTAISRAADLTMKLLAFARKSRLEIDVVDINQYVRGFESFIRRTIPSSVDLKITCSASLWPVATDVASFESALLNLVVNANDAMKDGGILTIETANVRVDDEYICDRSETIEPGRYVMVAVSDTGHGIPKDLLDRVFEPFFSTKEAGKGSGLGLPMVHGYLKQSGGTIRVYSEEGKGTCIKLYLKAVKSKASPMDEASSVKISHSPGSRILLCEDEHELRKILRHHLETVGYEVDDFGTGDEAYEHFLKRSDYDLVISDLVVPGKIQGGKLVEQIREIEPDIAVLFISGFAGEAVQELNGSASDEMVLSKPISARDFLDKVARLLSLRRG